MRNIFLNQTWEEWLDSAGEMPNDFKTDSRTYRHWELGHQVGWAIHLYNNGWKTSNKYPFV